MPTTSFTRPTARGPGWDRQQALQATLAQVERRYGHGAVWRLGGQPIAGVPVIPTGSLALDLALGVGGLPRGRISEVYGQEAAGKTTLALSVIAQAQQAGGTALFVDAEHALDLAYAQAVGVDMERLLVCQPDHAEHALEVLETLVRSGALAVAVVDSVPALLPKVELEGEIGDDNTGVFGRLMAQAMRKLAGPIATSGTTLVLVNQLRDNPAVLFGSPERVPGGRALKHQAAVRLDLRVRERLKDQGQLIGDRIRVKVVKNKVAAPCRAVELDLRYGQGIDRASELLDLGLAHGLIKQTGAGYRFGSSRLGAGHEDTHPPVPQRSFRPGRPPPSPAHQRPPTRGPSRMMLLLAAGIMVTILALFLGDSMLAFISDQLDRRRSYRLELEREQTRRVELQQRRDTMIWRQLQGDHQQPTNQGQP